MSGVSIINVLHVVLNYLYGFRRVSSDRHNTRFGKNSSIMCHSIQQLQQNEGCTCFCDMISALHF